MAFCARRLAVVGVYTGPPGLEGSRLLDTLCPDDAKNLVFGENSKVGTGGMQSKVRAACDATLDGVATVICDGATHSCISKVLSGKKIGTLFTRVKSTELPIEQLASESAHLFSAFIYIKSYAARQSGRTLAQLTNAERADIVRHLAQKLVDRQQDILNANAADLVEAERNGAPGKAELLHYQYLTGLEPQLLSRLKLTETKLKDLYKGLQMIADDAETLVHFELMRSQRNKCLGWSSIASHAYC